MGESKLLPELFAGLVGDAVERFLKLDPRSSDYLDPLSGKVIHLHLTPLNLQLYLCPGGQSFEILPSYQGKPDVTLSGSPLAFARMGLSESPRRALFAGEVFVEGDMKVAQRFQRLFEKLEIDWEGLIAKVAGQGLAAHLVGRISSSRSWLLNTLQSWEMNVAEYWKEESRELPAEGEMDIFLEDVDMLRADHDRLEARIARLERLLASDFGDGKLRGGTG